MTGFYVINKPTGTNSTRVVSEAKHITNQKCGHLGTLDPLASGVLPIAVGKATKLFDYFLKKDKKYFAIGLFGIETNTLDSEGYIITKQKVIIKKTQIDDILPQFCGEIEQIPPKFSAIKINGKRAYDLSRTEKSVNILPKKVIIYDIKAEQKTDNMCAFNMHVSAGTYVRTIISDIAKMLSTVATTTCIIRTASGPFTLEMSNTLDELKNGKAKLYAVDEILDLPKLNFDKIVAKKLLCGQTLVLNCKDGDALAYYNNKLLGIVKTTNQNTKLDINMWEENL